MFDARVSSVGCNYFLRSSVFEGAGPDNFNITFLLFLGVSGDLSWVGVGGRADLEKTPKENQGQILTQIRGILMGFIRVFRFL